MNASPEFPLAPAAFHGESREVDPGACFDWLQQGWAMFRAKPVVWLGSTVVLMVILTVISSVTPVGFFLAHLLAPLFGAGLLQICRYISDDNEVKIRDLFAGFQGKARPLLVVGVLFATGMFGLAFIGFLLVSGGVFGGVVTGSVAGFGIALGGIMLAALVVAVLSVPVIMATWFAPALVFFHDMKPAAAMRASFDAGARNWLAMTVFGIFLIVALFFAMLPLGLGMLLLMPIFSGAVYASYRDIFVGV